MTGVWREQVYGHSCSLIRNYALAIQGRRGNRVSELSCSFVLIVNIVVHKEKEKKDLSICLLYSTPAVMPFMFVLVRNWMKCKCCVGVIVGFIKDREKRKEVDSQARTPRSEKCTEKGCRSMQRACFVHSTEFCYLSVLGCGFQDSSNGSRLLLIPRSGRGSRWWRWVVGRIHHLIARLHWHLGSSTLLLLLL